MSRLILASSSPFRKAILQRLRIPFTCLSPNVDESPLPGESPLALALRLSALKAKAVLSLPEAADDRVIIIGCDQVCMWGDKALGKAGNADAAIAQLRDLSGQTVVFHSAMTVRCGDQVETLSVPTECVFRPLSEAEIAHYVKVDEPWDAAGSIHSEALGISLFSAMRSDDPTAIMGLPLIELSRLLRTLGLNPTLEALL